MTTTGELLKLEQLHTEAAEFAALLSSLALKEPLDSSRFQRLKQSANKASDRAERRYKASIQAYRATNWHKPS